MMARRTLLGLVVATALVGNGAGLAADADEEGATLLPTGQAITPLAARGTTVEPLNPHLAGHPEFTADHAVSLAVSPDGKTLLALTSGFNKLADISGDFVFVYDLSDGRPRQTQALTLPSSFTGIAFAPDGRRFFVGGGVGDSVYSFRWRNDGWSEDGPPLILGHRQGLGLSGEAPVSTAGLGVTADGHTLVVANMANDSLSVVDLAARRSRDLDLRPGHGRPGGTYPYGVAVMGNSTAFVSSLRDRQVVVVALGRHPRVVKRIAVPGNPNAMILDRAKARLFVACDNADQVVVIDTRRLAVVGRVDTTAPQGLLAAGRGYRGAAPNSLALSPDQSRLYVTNGGANSLALIDVHRLTVIGLIPTGWYPSAVAATGQRLVVANGKSMAGSNPGNCSGSTPDNDKKTHCRAAHAHVLQLEKAGLQSLPVPHADELVQLTRQVAANNRYRAADDPADPPIIEALRRHIRHIIYVVKENRTYDQVLGDLGRGNGDPHLTEFGQAITPNQHALASRFVTLDNFFDSGEVSGNGWPWSTAAGESDIGVKQMPPLYARRAQSYDVEGTNRGVNVGLATLAERRAANPDTPDDADLLPGSANVAAPDGPNGRIQHGYLWDAALRAGLTVRNYGFLCDLTRYGTRTAHPIPLERMPQAAGVVVAFPANPTLAPVTDPYFRCFDNKYPDLYRELEWEREFDRLAAEGDLPALSLVRLMHDHMGDFAAAIDHVDTPETQMADNDYAVGRLVEKVAASRFRDSTLIFVVEDDAQDGPDHVDAHRSIAFVAGPYVRQQAVVERRYTTVNVLRTIEDILGIGHLSLNDAYQRPMTEVFDLAQAEWSFQAHPADILYSTQLSLPPGRSSRRPAPAHDGAWWAVRTAGMDFSAEDRIDSVAFNRLLWEGLMAGRRYPAERSIP